ncbi:hypothetical protein FNW52_05605 [Flavobacterium sp. ZT3R18]|uniref:hypothetical protein n=1 Tax=Flavobacterium sp. ZT3R18 TaxID=2594429 RepID=UPI00117991D9|nr:hypothetical protein [Flavobacterium sp. ZT3R18]TRX37437.1 hypothetical protein FNW52_05605 [Flavobacterium sp. ZT3R18]
MKKALVYLALIASLNSCSQKKEQLKEINMNITSDNIADKITEQVKHYPKEPIYYLYASNSLCIYEILVNDYPIHKNYKYEQEATPIYINKAILKSGRQKITYRLYPAPAEFNGGSDVFDLDTKFDVKVCKQDLKRSGSHEVIKEEKTPIKEIKVGDGENEKEIEFVGKGKKYYEYSFYFDAEVPYENEGWSNGEDLREIDQNLLKEWVLKFYLSRKKEIDNKDLDAIARLAYLPLKEQFISEYSETDRIKKGWNEYVATYKNMTYQFQPFENYKMVLFGEGKIVCLRQISTDVRLREKSALWGKYKDENGNTRGDFHNLYLYLPLNGNLSDLQVIR